ncbi:amino acid carrier protein [Candidatus Jettenia caeni]|uniref:Amino acid carrier protein n=1 Tax=Candidatus Jettenia caeni TaxID=247490 RepID=I3IKX1_9BACT|nr:sodium:alanine symporter family protein [Candidatus Jettenia sp. AMX1]MCQ3928756.1 sodium:alanine symporter family protein [Candidatus Jettenia sp.]WKZ14213.1 MAG: sodium:alanine symporter family protein [Candidatus Jettenia caeni]KAA0246725.1 MAG: sodium:alanine symporter family protein [Candidatus Jettenia sp. AMX1]MDL1940638.1 sodium:alanine symporter family protein [Candidatus Jettenia sp. AMX1]GAB62366.1 amino acid carrier protein [Candidatus Jettenia caeni]
MEKLIELIHGINTFVWGLPMVVAIVGIGLFLTVLSRFIQIRKFMRMWRETFIRTFRKESSGEGDISPFQALNVALGGTVGVGNIAGVATAIAAGGPGAIFWMWISGIVGMGTKFFEVALGIHYRTREPGGPMVGGPMMYISRGMGSRWRWLAFAFALFGALAAFGIGNMVQANSVAEGLQYFNIPSWITGIGLLIFVGLVTIGGIKRIAHVAMFCVPVMCVLYMLGAAAIIIWKINYIPSVLTMIIHDAFHPRAAIGGFAGATIMQAIRYGISRGTFSNEAGLGSAPIAHATAKTDHPVRQAFWGMMEVFVDTVIMCSATALVIILTGAWSSGETGASLTIHGFSSLFGLKFGSALVAFCMVLTAYDTNIAWCFYGETCAAYLLGHGRIVRYAYRFLWLPFVLIGALLKLDAVWGIADILNGLMAVPNLIALIVLAPLVVKLIHNFENSLPVSRTFPLQKTPGRD